MYYLATLVAVLVVCSNAAVPCSDGIRLTGPDAAKGKGILQAFIGGDWRPVCNLNWGTSPGRTVCRSVGFPGFVSYGTPSSELVNYNITKYRTGATCSGTESCLNDCTDHSWSVTPLSLSNGLPHPCYTANDKPFQCWDGMTTAPPSTLTPTPTTTTGTSRPSAATPAPPGGTTNPPGVPNPTTDIPTPTPAPEPYPRGNNLNVILAVTISAVVIIFTMLGACVFYKKCTDKPGYDRQLNASDYLRPKTPPNKVAPADISIVWAPDFPLTLAPLEPRLAELLSDNKLEYHQHLFVNVKLSELMDPLYMEAFLRTTDMPESDKTRLRRAINEHKSSHVYEKIDDVPEDDGYVTVRQPNVTRCSATLPIAD